MGENEIKVGDSVKLKSGGPTMTVRTIARDGDEPPYAICDWFEGTKRDTRDFPLTSLILED